MYNCVLRIRGKLSLLLLLLQFRQILLQPFHLKLLHLLHLLILLFLRLWMH